MGETFYWNQLPSAFHLDRVTAGRSKPRPYKVYDDFGKNSERRAALFQKFADGGEGVFFSVSDFAGQLGEAGVGVRAAENFLEEPRLGEFDQALLPVFDVFAAAFAAGFEVSAEFGDGGGERIDAFAFGGYRADDRRMPTVARHHQDSMACSSCSRRSAPSRSDLLSTKMSAISIKPAFMF